MSLDKDTRIKDEIERLTGLFQDMEENKLNTVNALIKNAAFMTITLEDLQEAININGTISEYKNGENQFGTKKSPEVEVYNTMIKNFASIIKQLTDMLPVGEKGGSDELINFLKKK